MNAGAGNRHGGRTPKPLEEKFRLGNPSGRPLPERSELMALPGVVVDEAGALVIPDPPDELGPEGIETWQRIWVAGARWISTSTDVHAVQLLCEQIDERADLRRRVKLYNDWRERSALRTLERQIMAGLALLGLNPVDRSRLGVAIVQTESTIDRIRRERAGGQ